jgi:hypothetical protein
MSMKIACKQIDTLEAVRAAALVHNTRDPEALVKLQAVVDRLKECELVEKVGPNMAEAAENAHTTATVEHIKESKKPAAAAPKTDDTPKSDDDSEPKGKKGRKGVRGDSLR